MGKTKYSVNHNYFSNDWWSHNKAWILGFTQADGCVVITEDRLSYRLHIKDSKILEFIKKELEYTGIIGKVNIYDIRTNKYYNQAVLQISSKQIKEDLIKLGITPQKTGKEVFCNIPQEYIYSYIRGIFDGDGSICICKNNKHPILLDVTNKKNVKFIYDL
jgi:intein-encoded DNA endonuclease-like protein